MSNTYKWIISQLECYPQHEGRTDVVVTVHWRRQATDGNGNNGEIYGSQVIAFNPSEPFTAYLSLTQKQVEGWLEEALGADTLAVQEAILDQQISDLINPPIITLPLPWMNA